MIKINKTANCKYCNKEYPIANWQIKSNKKPFCNRTCYNKYRLSIPPYERFWKYVEKTDSCWVWKGCTWDSGYGTLQINKRPHLVHRFSYILHFGEIPNNLFVCHTCDIPNCVNPKHLFLGTTQDNTKDKVRKNRQAKGKTAGAYTHPEKILRGSMIGISKLKEEDVIKIRNTCNEISRKELAKIYNVKNSAIDCVINRKTWKHVL